MTLVDSVKNYIYRNNMLQPGDVVLAAVSGGADSICLLLCLIQISKEIPISLNVFHYDHRIRKESADDARFVEDICKEYEIDCFIRSGDVIQVAKETGISTEEAARNLRYEAMYEVADNLGNQVKLAFAHNLGDRAETVLFRLFRGTGIKGLRGIKPVIVKSGYTIIRPLLETDRIDIESFLRLKGQSWVEDATNQGDEYARNRIRHHIISYAQGNINEKAVNNIIALSNEADEAYEYIMRNVIMAYNRCQVSDGRISIKRLLKEDKYLHRHIILYMLEQITSHRKDISRTHADSLVKLIESSRNAVLSLPYGIRAIKEYDLFRLEKETDFVNPPVFKIEFELLESPPDTEIPMDKYTKWMDYDKITNQPVIRTRQTGDYIYINEKNQKVSLKKYFINEKVPPSERDSVQLVADGSHILWIVGYRLSAKVKITKGTKRVLRVTAK